MAEQGIPDAIACDGKPTHGSGNGTTKLRHLVSAVVHGATRVITQTAVEEKSNEIPAMYPWLYARQGAIVCDQQSRVRQRSAGTGGMAVSSRSYVPQPHPAVTPSTTPAFAATSWRLAHGNQVVPAVALGVTDSP
jgi:hypothetical protein